MGRAPRQGCVALLPALRRRPCRVTRPMRLPKGSETDLEEAEMRRRTTEPDHGDARAAAVRTYGPGTLIFADLEIGERFHFASSPCASVCVKIRRRRYSLAGRVCYAQPGQAVVRLTVSETGSAIPA